jgi:hypothetical protein
MRDREAGLVMGILCTLHACFEAVDLDDAVLRLSVSLKLALLLEEPSQQARVCDLCTHTATPIHMSHTHTLLQLCTQGRH